MKTPKLDQVLQTLLLFSFVVFVIGLALTSELWEAAFYIAFDHISANPHKYIAGAVICIGVLIIALTAIALRLSEQEKTWKKY